MTIFLVYKFQSQFALMEESYISREFTGDSFESAYKETSLVSRIPSSTNESNSCFATNPARARPANGKVP